MAADDERVLQVCPECQVAGRASKCWLCGGPTVTCVVNPCSSPVETSRGEDDG